MTAPTDVAQLHRELAELRARNDQLVRRATDAESALEAFARGEVDAVAIAAVASPVLLHAAQEQLRASRHLLRAIFDSAMDAILMADDDGVYVDANPAACVLFDLPLDQLLGRRFSDFLPPGVDGTAGFQQFLAIGHMTGLFPIRRLDGTTATLDFSGVANVAPHRHISFLRDITERFEALAALRQSRDELEEAQMLAHLGRWSAGVLPDDEISWSSECYRIFGLPSGTPVTMDLFMSRVHPADRVTMNRAITALLVADQPHDIEVRVEWPDGTLRWIQSRAIVDRDASHRPTRMRGTVQDVTDRHDASAAIQASEEQYRRIVDNTSEGVWLYDTNYLTTFMNRRMADLLGYSVDEAIGRHVHTFMDESQRAAADAKGDNRRRGMSERHEFRLRHRDGSAVWVSLQATPILGADGAFDGAIVLATDISMQMVADRVRARLAAIVESSDDAIVSIGANGHIETWNRSAEALYQYEPEEVLGRPVTELFGPASREVERRSHDHAALGESVESYETMHLRKDGTLVDVAVSFSPIRDANGTLIASAMIARDLTTTRLAESNHRRTEEQFRQAQKMEAVGRLAGGVAHDFNNLLSVILSYSQFAIEDLKPGDPLRNDMIQIDEAGRRATDLTRQLLAFSRQQVLQPRVLDINAILPPMERMLRRLIGEDVALTLLTASDLGRVIADAGQLEQVVMNLAVNARDAMPLGGSLTIETTHVRFEAGDDGGPAGITPGDYVVLAVSDTGSGMDADTCAQVFEPFFTTKGPGKGTGLGLSTVFGIVRQSEGFISVHSELERGTTFKVYLPMTDRPADQSATDSTPAGKGSETILLVEDEDQVRAVAAAILRRHGYNVLETSNGGEAFLVAKSFGSPIQLLLTDVVMPRMSGRALAEELTPLRPDMRVLYASGYTDDAIIHHGVLQAGVAFIQKPFTPTALLRKVREVLDAPEKEKAAK